ncbi:MAG: hypothetical protein N2043_01525 [Ignavibacterium sp.]|nr:hypothetical protein [Ignavibacterium sp.]
MFDVKVGNVIYFTYTNWRGETSKRKAIVQEFVFGSNQWHKEPQFMIKGFDLDKASVRMFATKDISELKVIERKTQSIK